MRVQGCKVIHRHKQEDERDKPVGGDSRRHAFNVVDLVFDVLTQRGQEGRPAVDAVMVGRDDHEGWELKGRSKYLVVRRPKLRDNDDVDAERQPCITQLSSVSGHWGGVHDRDGKAVQA